MSVLNETVQVFRVITAEMRVDSESAEKAHPKALGYTRVVSVYQFNALRQYCERLIDSINREENHVAQRILRDSE